MPKKWKSCVHRRQAKATSTTNFDDLPREIVAEILWRLPVDLLMECKCINKSWYFAIKCLMKDPEFVAKHLRHARSSPATLLVYYRILPEDKLMTSFLTISSCDNGDKSAIRLVSEDLNIPLHLTKKDYMGVHHCDGIVCLIKDTRTVALCNLALHKLSILYPKTNLAIENYNIIGTGFGSDSGAGNYKIVRLLESMKAEVFTLGTSDFWREISISIDRKQYGKLDSHVYLNGKCFWLMSGVTLTVICFDVSSEVFHTVPLPNAQNFYSDECSLTIRDDSLCLLCYTPATRNGNSISVWQLDINSDGGGIEGDTYSWKKCLKTKRLGRFYVPLTFLQSDELLMDDEKNLEPFYNPQTEKAPMSDDEFLMDTEKDLILSYNIQTRKLKKLPVYGTLGPICYSGPFVKSLVSIKEKIKINL